jgi:3-dehydroquinate dehydratase-2
MTADFYQSNIEGELVGKIQEISESADGLIINAAAFTHTSVAILDALNTLNIPKIEVHISNVFAREEFRHKSMISKSVNGIICGFGLNSYILAVDAIERIIKNENK